MNTNRISFIVGLFLIVSGAAQADGLQCPSTIYYKNGNYLKSGNTYYFPNGNYAISGSTAYYPNGNYLKSGSTFYYENGNYLKSGTTLYYPSGNYLKSGSTYYYANGNYLKSGTTFYYANGNYARSGSTLYRADGSQTPFPVTLVETIGQVGRMTAVVQSKSESIEIDFESLTSTAAGVELKLIWDEDHVALTHFLLSTGHENEKVHIDVTENGIECGLVGGPDPLLGKFTLTGAAATIDVRVNPGTDIARVREVLQRALDSLGK